MSRHKLVKNLDLDDELDDFDGGDDYYDDDGGAGEELSEEDKEQMRLGTIAVREAIGPDVPGITDGEIQEALWHYYYDVGKSVTYLLNSRTEKPKKAKKANDFVARYAFEPPQTTLTARTMFADFFRDMPWLATPVDRQTAFAAPSHPKGGLLGGSSEPPKMSKLQALAAARKKKAQEQKSSSSSDAPTNPMSKLSLAGDSKIKDSKSAFLNRSNSSTETSQNTAEADVPKPSITPNAPSPSDAALLSSSDAKPSPLQVEIARPSAFASTMFGDEDQSPPHARSSSSLIVPYFNPHSDSADAFSGPSPDDVVIAAQSKAKTKEKKKEPPKTNGEKRADQIANGVANIKMDETPRATSKELDVLAEYQKSKKKKAANFVVIGHVDAGKSTLMGRLLMDLKVVDERTIEKYRKEADKMGKSSFALAWVLDQGSEERSRGVTIDIATNKFETASTDFTILDAPGHRDFIPNMIAGASQADFAVLVIDASTGSFESGLKGQTKEHALLVRSMGVQRLIVAVNKLDTVGWSQERFDEIHQQVSSFLTAAGFPSKNLSFVPVSGLKGDNITRRSTDPAASWYQGPILIEELDNSEPVARALDKPFRFTISDIFRGGVQNPLSVSGRIEAGSIQTGDALRAQPSGEKCYIKGIEADAEPVDWAVAGHISTIHLSDIDPAHLKTGDVLCSISNPVKCIKEFTVKALAFEFLTPMQVDVHRGRLHVPGRIRELSAVLDKGSGAVIKKKPKIVKPGAVARIVVELEEECPLEAPGKVVLRSNGETVAAGLLE